MATGEGSNTEGESKMTITTKLFEDESIGDRIYRRIDEMIDPCLEREFLKALDKVDAISRKLHEELYSAFIAYAAAREESAFVLGVQTATGPSLWMFETKPEPREEEKAQQIEAMRQRKEEAKQEMAAGIVMETEEIV